MCGLRDVVLFWFLYCFLLLDLSQVDLHQHVKMLSVTVDHQVGVHDPCPSGCNLIISEVSTKTWVVTCPPLLHSHTVGTLNLHHAGGEVVALLQTVIAGSFARK